jgi:uncharacterized protein YsxB (DUF464 family)
MISIILYKREGNNVGYRVSGHAGYGERGDDVVCSAVSVLAINTENALEILTDDRYTLEYNDDGMIDLRIDGNRSYEASILLSAFEIGVTSISEEYGKDFIQIRIEEV